MKRIIGGIVFVGCSYTLLLLSSKAHSYCAFMDNYYPYWNNSNVCTSCESPNIISNGKCYEPEAYNSTFSNNNTTVIVIDNSLLCRQYGSHSFSSDGICKCDVGYYFYTGANGNRQCLLKDDTMMCGKNGLFIEKLSTCGCKDGYTRVKGECIDYNTDCRNNNGPKSYYITGSMTGEIGYRQYFCGCSSGSVLYADKCRESTKYIRGIVDNVTRTSFDLNYIWFDTKLYSATIGYNKTYCGLINIKNNTVVDIYIGMDNIVGTGDTLYDTGLKNSCNIDSMTWNIIGSKSVLKYISTPSSECLKNKGIWNRKKKTCTYKK